MRPKEGNKLAHDFYLMQKQYLKPSDILKMLWASGPIKRSNSFSIPKACQLREPVANIKHKDLGNGSGPEELRNKNNTVHMNNTFTVGNGDSGKNEDIVVDDSLVTYR